MPKQKQKLTVPTLERQASQGATFEEMICEVCSKQDKSNVPATGYCTQCVSYFCTPCLKVHEVILPEHHQLLGQDVPKHFSLEKCPVHPAEFVKYYCLLEHKFECKVCNDGKKCFSCRVLPDFVEDMRETNERGTFLRNYDLCKSKVEELKKNVEVNSDLHNICSNNSKTVDNIDSLKDVPRKSGRSMYMVEVLDRDQIENDATEIQIAGQSLDIIKTDVLDRMETIPLCQFLMEMKRKKPLLDQTKSKIQEVDKELEITSYKVGNADLKNKSNSNTSRMLPNGKQIFQKCAINVGNRFNRLLGYLQTNNIISKVVVILIVSILLSTMIPTGKLEPEMSHEINPSKLLTTKVGSDQHAPKISSACYLPELSMCIIIFDEQNANIKMHNISHFIVGYQLEPYSVFRSDFKCNQGNQINLVRASYAEVLIQVVVVQAKKMKMVFRAKVDMSCKDVTWLDPDRVNFLCLFKNQSVATVVWKEQEFTTQIIWKEEDDLNITEVAYSISTETLYYTVTGIENKVCQRRLSTPGKSICYTSHSLRGPFSNLIITSHDKVIVSNGSSNDMMFLGSDFSSVERFHVQKGECQFVCIAATKPNKLFERVLFFVEQCTGDVYFAFHFSTPHVLVLLIIVGFCITVMISCCCQCGLQYL